MSAITPGPQTPEAPAPTPEDARLPTMLNALAEQRNNALDTVAQIQGELAVRDRQLADLQAQIEDLKQQLEKAKGK